MLQWILRAGIPESAAKHYESVIDSTDLSLSGVAEMNAGVFGLLLHGNITDARDIQNCIRKLETVDVSLCCCKDLQSPSRAVFEL